MIPRALPGLWRAGVENGWRVVVDPYPHVLFAHFYSDAHVEIQWAGGNTIASEINGQPTPYMQCTRLIRSKESHV